MATLPSFFRRAIAAPARRPEAVRATYDPYRLRALPHEDVYLYSKRVDNSRVVREADPQAGRICRSAVGMACACVALLCLILAPNLANTFSASKLERLRTDERVLLEQRQYFQAREAELLSPQHLDELAKARGLVTPAAGQVKHLEPKDEGAVALARH
jgi:hypothetical protein